MTENAKQKVWLLMLFGMIVLFTGCSSSNKKDTASFDLSTGRHSGNWSSPDAHGASAKTQSNGFAICQECHATDFSGGISTTSCFTCHGVNAPHAPAPWRGGTYTHTNTNQGNAPICALCHTNGANSSLVPATPAPAGSAPGCFNNTLCHAVPGHPTGWNAPSRHGVSAKAANGFSACESCHATDFTGGIANTACSSCHGVNAPHPPKPWRDAATYTHTTTDQSNASVCAQCHTNGANSSLAPTTPAPAGTAPGCFNSTLCHATPSCGSCHGIPPSGASSPNVAGKHSVHTGLGSYIACDACHTGAGPGTSKHQNGVADVTFASVYNAKSGGSASYNAATNTCSNVSCHGGQTTPNWLTGSIDVTVNAGCTSCHASGTSHYNSYHSGRHSVSDHVSKGCTSCHDTTSLATNHFTHLDTTAMEGPASATIKAAVQYNGSTCNPSNGGLSGCHSSKSW